MYKRLFPYAIVFITIQTLLRLTILARAYIDIDITTQQLFMIMAKGLWIDSVVCSFFMVPIALYHLLLPEKLHSKPFDIILSKITLLIFTSIFLFDAIAEHIFWTEFTTRFNFIAVDYLIYTQEVIGNIFESYPVYWIVSAIIVAAFIVSISIHKLFMKIDSVQPAKRRITSFCSLVAICILLNFSSSIEHTNIDNNAEASEIAANGIYNLFYAFRHNEINYDQFYKTASKEEVIKNARGLLFEQNNNFIHDSGDDLTRLVKSNKPEQHKNVIIVVMESMSADYMGVFGNNDSLTNNLDRLSSESLFFTNTYATGTRTVRGLEAITLSIPPTPGQSIVRRPENENLFSLGFIFKDRGYDTKFIYGGYGYFDNMNKFFSGNGFDVLDRNKLDKSEISFSNIWGVCDEDMFKKAISKADISFQNNKPFMQLIMTTSNHRPYTYPDGKIDIKSHSSRNGGVKYADYSIGTLVEQAKTKPWFKDTVFVFIADHTAGAGGKAELDPKKYHIPMMFYSPEFIKPQRFDNIASQIDMAPILLGLLDFSYYTKFYGEDLLNDDDEIPHAFISNYQKVALVKENELTVLAPKQKIEQYSWPQIAKKSDIDQDRISDSIGYYQSASWWKEQYKKLPSTIYKNTK
jgi:phosphoglycerol transferase MdoB-like AlkP superfamily enzyme